MDYILRQSIPEEFSEIGELMVRVYSQLDGFPKKTEQPDYYKLLADVGRLTLNPETELIVAVAPGNKLAGAVLYIGDMKYYGSGGIATKQQNASGFRLLTVDPVFRGHGIGKLLTYECIRKTREKNHEQLIIHSTLAMKIAWKMYEKTGFKRSEDLDFMQGNLPVFGFRLMLSELR